MSWFGRLASWVTVAGVIAAGASMPAAAGDDDTRKLNWSGVYVGVNAGWVDADYSSAFPATPTDGSGRLDGRYDSAILGGHVGLQHQMGQLVVGVEATFSGSINEWGQQTESLTPHCFENDISGLRCMARFDQFFTIGPRLGWSPSSQWLLFVDGGYASALLDDRYFHYAPPAGVTPHDDVRSSVRHDGWFVGGGVEYALTRNWIAGIDYQHVDLSNNLHCGSLLSAPCAFAARIAEGDADIVSARLSFKFVNWPSPSN